MHALTSLLQPPPDPKLEEEIEREKRAEEQVHEVLVHIYAYASACELCTYVPLADVAVILQLRQVKSTLVEILMRVTDSMMAEIALEVLSEGLYIRRNSTHLHRSGYDP